MNYNIQVETTANSKISEVDFNNLPFGRIFTDHMFIAEYSEGEWGKFRIQPFGNLNLHPAITALHYGQSIFEGLKAMRDKDGNPVVFRPIDNARRMNESAKRMAMPEFPVELFMQVVNDLVWMDKDWIPNNPDYSLYIRPIMFACDEYVGIKASDNYMFLMFCLPVGAYYDRPVKVYMAEDYVRAFPGGTGAAKVAGNYAATLMPVQQIQAKGYDQILWLDGIHRKYVQEIGTMNVFFQMGHELITTPISEDTILPGITRNSVIQLARENGLSVTERLLSVEEIFEAHENGSLKDAFGAGTAAVISHISDIGYRDKNIELPAVESRDTSLMLKDQLQKIKRGEIADKHDWNFFPKASVAV